MDVGTQQFADLYGVSKSTVARWCREGLIEGASQDDKGHPWHIPKTSKPPYNYKKVKK